MKGLRTVLTDSIFLITEKLINFGLAFAVSIYVVRYLGPSDYGILEYATSLTILAMPFGRLGTVHIAVKDLVLSDGSNKNDILGTVYTIMLGAGLVATIGLIIIGFSTEDDTTIRLLIGVISIKIIFQSFDAFDVWYQSLVKSKYSVLARIGYQLTVSLSKLAFVTMSLSLVYFGISIILGSLIQAIILFLIYQKKFGNFMDWKFDSGYAKELLTKSWPLLISGLSLALYMRVDQIMLRHMVDLENVGNYSVAVRISSLWYFIPMAVTTSLFPTIIKSKVKSESLYMSRMKFLYEIMIVIAVLPAALMSFIGEQLIIFIYGTDFQLASQILTIHIWSGIFVFMGVVRSKWIVNENLQKFGMLFNIGGALINILLNFLLIPKYGALGAAYTTLISQICSSFLFGFLFDKTRSNFYLQLRSMFNVVLIFPFIFSTKKKLNQFIK